MAKGQPLSRHQESIVRRYYEHLDSTTLQKLGELVSDLYLADGAAQQERLWKQAGTALARTAAHDARVSRILAQRDVKALAALVGELHSAPPGGSRPSSVAPAPGQPPPASAAAPPAAAAAPPAAPGHGAAPTDPANPDTLRAALKAFRKRLKLTRLDEESKLGRSPLTGGQRSRIVAIQPPQQFPPAVWEALADQGKLRRAGRGFYELVEP